MKKLMSKLSMAVLLIAVLASSAEACRFGTCRSCVVRRHVKKIAPVVVQQPNVYVIQQNQAAPLVAQGSSVYRSAGYQSAVLPYFDPNQFARDNSEILRQAQSLVTGGQSASLAWAERITALQSEAFTADAKGRALSIVADAMGLASPTGNQSQGVVIVPDGSGGYNVQQLTLQQVETIVQRQSVPNAGQLTESGQGSVIELKCGKCHGGGLAAPKNGLHLAPGFPLTMQQVAEALRRVGHPDTPISARMPPEGEPQLTDEEKGRFFEEIYRLAGVPETPPQ